jgi:transcriptional regulator with XRE-family HTH domain
MSEMINKKVRPPLAEAIFKLRKTSKFTQVDISKRLGVGQSAVALWEKGPDKPSAQILLKLSEMAPEHERHWWYEQAGPIFAEKLRSEPTAKKEERSTDGELLAAAMEAVTATAERMQEFLTKQKYAEIVAKVYDDWRETGQRDCSIIGRFIRRARGPSDQKGMLR